MLDFGGPAMVECAKVKQLPTIAFKIGGKEFMLEPKQYILKIDAGGLSSRFLFHILLLLNAMLGCNVLFAGNCCVWFGGRAMVECAKVK